jgi:cell division protein FtsI (penicillin-binding protein 3)
VRSTVVWWSWRWPPARSRPISNLTRSNDSTYVESLNYAVGTATEPGLHVQVGIVDGGFEDGPDQSHGHGGHVTGRVRFYDRIMRDSHEDLGMVGSPCERAFELSTNTGISLAVTKAYGKDPKRFVEGLKRMGLHQPTGVLIPGEPCPPLRGPGEKGWSGVSLPWMSIGYETLFTPLQTLTFYNAVANNGGRMMQPSSWIMFHGRDARLRNSSPWCSMSGSASKATLEIAHRMLQNVVDTGTAMNLKGAHFKIAGKTGTAQIASKGSYKQNGVSYQASFAGYFPAEAPKYSCIVVVNGPTMSGYYGNVVAGPIFKEIADKIYSNRLELQQPTQLAEPVGRAHR